MNKYFFWITILVASFSVPYGILLSIAPEGYTVNLSVPLVLGIDIILWPLLVSWIIATIVKKVKSDVSSYLFRNTFLICWGIYGLAITSSIISAVNFF